MSGSAFGLLHGCWQRYGGAVPFSSGDVLGRTFRWEHDGATWLWTTNGWGATMLKVDDDAIDLPAHPKGPALAEWSARPRPIPIDLTQLWKWALEALGPCPVCASPGKTERRTSVGIIAGRALNRALLLRTIEPVMRYAGEPASIEDDIGDPYQLLSLSGENWRAFIMPMRVDASETHARFGEPAEAFWL